MKSQVNYRGRKIDYIGSEKDKAKVERLMDTYTEQLDMFEDSSYSSKPNRDIALLEEYEEIEIGTREALIVENNKETKKVIIQYIDDDEMEEFTYDELDSKLNQGRKNIDPSGLSRYVPMGGYTPSPISKGDYLMVTKKGDENEGKIGKNISVQSFYGNNPVVLLDFEQYGGGKKRYQKSEVTDEGFDAASDHHYYDYILKKYPNDAITDVYDDEFFRWGNAKINENWERSPLDFNDKGEIIFKPNTSEAEKKRIKAEFEKDIKEMSRMRYDNGGALDKEFKFDKNFVIYVPSTTDVGSRIDRTDLDARVSAVEKFVSERFGGFTKIDSDGGYKANSGDIIEEDIVKVSVFAKDLDWKEHENEVVAKVKQWAKDWGQEAIGFEYEGNLYYIEEDEKFSWGGGIAVGAVVGGYIGYKIGRWRPQKKGFDTEKKIAKKVKTSVKKGWNKLDNKKDSEKKMSKGGIIYDNLIEDISDNVLIATEDGKVYRTTNVVDDNMYKVIEQIDLENTKTHYLKKGTKVMVFANAFQSDNRKSVNRFKKKMSKGGDINLKDSIRVNGKLFKGKVEENKGYGKPFTIYEYRGTPIRDDEGDEWVDNETWEATEKLEKIFRDKGYKVQADYNEKGWVGVAVEHKTNSYAEGGEIEFIKTHVPNSDSDDISAIMEILSGHSVRLNRGELDDEWVMNDVKYNTDEALEYIRSSIPNSDSNDLQKIVSVLGGSTYAEGGKIKSVSARRYEDLDYTDNELGERYYVEYNLYYDTDQFEETDEPDYESFDTEEEALKQVEYVNNNNQKFIEAQGYNNTYAEGGKIKSTKISQGHYKISLPNGKETYIAYDPTRKLWMERDKDARATGMVEETKWQILENISANQDTYANGGEIDAYELTQSEVDKIILALELMYGDESKYDKKGMKLAEKISKAKRFIIVNK